MTDNGIDKAMFLLAMQDVKPIKQTNRIPYARPTLHLPKRKPTKPTRRTWIDAYPAAFWSYKG